MAIKAHPFAPIHGSVTRATPIACLKPSGGALSRPARPWPYYHSEIVSGFPERSQVTLKLLVFDTGPTVSTEMKPLLPIFTESLRL